ncbi:MAG: 4-(cytidine 5'-diphospho)-2-C-methyl-D-erythritol kinase [Eubacteriales bacterium]|nr:4-(cytidine 5'-diphospho)-2-C-methyl-D-erythritol kinase [Eubacteriales bacterium]
MLINLKARAKINLSLDVLGKRPDGYHEIRTIMQSLELHDKVTVWEIEKGIELQCNNPLIPCDSRNTAFKAAGLMLDRYLPGKGVGIRIEKNIPVAAGLAGGSADAAEVLKGINRLFELGLSEGQLMETGKRVGADVPFCIKGGTALAEGIGEKITPIASMPATYVLLVCPNIAVRTAEVYERLNLCKISERPDIVELIKHIEVGKLDRLGKCMVNVLETVTAKEYKIIGEIKSRLMKAGAFASLMSGSGPTVFGLFKEKSGAIEGKRAIEAEIALGAETDDKSQTVIEAETLDKASVEFAKAGTNCFITKTYNEEC